MKAQEFTIKELESFSGVKAHTIRIWEQRYGLLAPDRTDTNIRRYNDKDLKKLLNISLLNSLGYKISAISKMSDADMTDEIAKHNAVNPGEAHRLNSLKVSMLNYDEMLFDEIVDGHIEKYGLELTFKDVLLPFLNEIGLLWQTDAICPAHEHFISNLVRTKLLHHVSLVKPKSSDGSERTFVLFLPDLEIHELSLIMINYMLRVSGFRTIFLGISVPADDLKQIYNRIGSVEFISIFTTHPPMVLLNDYLKKLAMDFEDTPCHFHLSGYLLKGVKSPDSRTLSIYPDLGKLLESIRNN